MLEPSIINNSFSKNHRLLSKQDFDNLRSNSKFSSSGILVSYYKKNSLNHARLGLAISKKAGNAVKRNKIKRKLRENFRTSEIVNESIDIVISLNFKKIKSKKISYREILSQLNHSFDTLKLS